MPTYTIQRTGTIVYFPAENARVIVRDNNGICWACYLESIGGVQSIIIGRSADNGLTWVQDSIITDPPNDYDNPTLGVDAFATLHLAAYHQGSGMVYLRQPAGGAWAAEVILFATLVPLEIALAVDGNNNVNIVTERTWGGARGIVYYQRTAAGVWLPQEVVSWIAGNNQGSPCIAVGLTNIIHVLWDGDGWAGFPAVDQIVYRSRIAGVWQATEQLTNVNNDHGQSQIAVDRLGYVHASWTRNPGAGNYWLQYNRRIVAWGAIIEVALNWPAPGAVTYQSITVDNSDLVYIHYRQLDGGGLQQAYHREVVGGAAFGAEVQDTAFTLAGNNLIAVIGMFGTFPQLGGFSTTNPATGLAYMMAYWHGGTDFEVMVFVAASWFSPVPFTINKAYALAREEL